MWRSRRFLGGSKWLNRCLRRNSKIEIGNGKIDGGSFTLLLTIRRASRIFYVTTHHPQGVEDLLRYYSPSTGRRGLLCSCVLVMMGFNHYLYYSLQRRNSNNDIQFTDDIAFTTRYARYSVCAGYSQGVEVRFVYIKKGRLRASKRMIEKEGRVGLL